MKKVGLASDHAGFELKEFVKTWLTEQRFRNIQYRKL